MQSTNFFIYDQSREVPRDAQRAITAGRLKGMTNINPMWRIKRLTEMFGPCGIGWKYVITRQWTETGAGGEIIACCNIDLYIRYNDVWSEAIPGTGGSALVAQEQKGLHTSDECFKMALTDALSVACKALGIGADVYWKEDRTKYDRRGFEQQLNVPAKPEPKKNEAAPANKPEKVPVRDMETIYKLGTIANLTRQQVDDTIIKSFNLLDPRDMDANQFGEIYKRLNAKITGGQANA